MEGIIVDAHIKVYRELSDIHLIKDAPVTSINPDGTTDSSNSTALDLRRLKNENIFFILLSLFQLVLGIDAVSNDSLYHVHYANSICRLLDKV